MLQKLNVLFCHKADEERKELQDALYDGDDDEEDGRTVKIQTAKKEKKGNKKSKKGSKKSKSAKKNNGEIL